MAGATSNALEWALALLQAPEQRHVLKQRPLPEGMDELLTIAASASPDVLQRAAQRFSEPQAKICEAARFYVREVLFHPQADAYRMLGVGAHSSLEQIKNHHRLLQFWLHPDRLQNTDDAVFAARVNHAWNQLRTPQRRAAYDAALNQQAHPEPMPNKQSEQLKQPKQPDRWEGGAVTPAWRRRLPVLLLVLLCAVLLLFSVYDLVQAPEGSVRVLAQRNENNALPAETLRWQEVEKGDTQKADTQKVDAQTQPAAMPSPRKVAAAPQLSEVLPSISQPSKALLSETLLSETPYPAPPQVAVKTKNAVQAAAATASAKPVLEQEAQPLAAEPSVAPRQPAMQQVALAQQTGGQLLDYLQKPKLRAPPIWNNPAVLQQAEQLRAHWAATGRVRLQVAQWRVGAETAELTAGYAAQKNATEAGQLVATLRWRDGAWFVSNINMETQQ